MGRNRRRPHGRPPQPSTTVWNRPGFKNEGTWHAQNRHNFRQAPLHPSKHGWPARHSQHQQGQQQTHCFRYPRPPPIVRNESPPPISRSEQRQEKFTPVRQLQTNVVNHVKAPANHVKAPVNHVKAPVNHVKAPVNHVKAPVNHVKAPVNHVKAPVNHVKAKPAPYIDPTLPRFDTLSPTVVTFKQLVNRLLSSSQNDFIFQRKTVVEMIYVYLQLESVQQKFQCLEFLLNKDHSDGYGIGMDYKGKLLLWTLCELLSHYSGFFENYEVEMAGLINKRFDKVVHKSKEDNFKEMLAIRQQLASILPFFNFSFIDESANKRYPYGKLTNFLTWAKSVRLVPPVNQRNFINLWNSEDRKRIELIDKSLADAKRTKILPPPPPKPRNEIPKFERVLPPINRPRTPPIKPPPQKILDIIDIQDTEDVSSIDEAEFDRRILFSPVPSEASEDNDNSQGSQTEVISNVVPIPTFAPVQNFDEFLKSCREEKEKIETEKLNAFSNTMNRLQNQNNTMKTLDKQPVEHSDHTEVSKKTPRNEALEAVKKRIQEANAAALKPKEISPPASKKAKTVVGTADEKASFWNSSIVPSINCIVGKKDEKLKSIPKPLPKSKGDDAKKMCQVNQQGK